MDQKIAQDTRNMCRHPKEAKNRPLHPGRFELPHPKILELESSPLDRSGMNAANVSRGIKI